MISRRSLLTGLSILPLAGGIVGCAARASTTGASTTGGNTASGSAQALGGPIPVVSPGARWNGTALSGGTPPVDPVRTTAKPAIHWLVPSDLRLVSNLTIGVDADANGGVKQVDFWVEGQVQTVTAPTIYTDTDANGATRNRYGYWITLNASAFNAISTTGEARLYATAVPNDARMQSRVIGGPLIDGSGYDTGQYGGNYPLSVFPRAVANDRSYTVAASGAQFTTLAAAIAQAVSDTAQAPLITITQTGNYELGNAGSNYGSGKGFMTITTAPGITATLGRAAAFTANSPSSWNWTPGWDGIEFRGNGIVFDTRNWSQIAFTSKPAWFNGCKWTNSIGTLYTYYWNGAVHPGYGASVVGTGVRNYWDDCFIEYNTLQAALGGQRYVRGCSIHQQADDIFSATHYVANNYVRGFNYQFVLGSYGGVVNYAGITITGPANATVSKTAGDAQGGNLLLRISGSTVATIALGYYGSDTNPTINAVVSAINTYGNGWSASAQNGRGAMRPSQIGTPTGAGGQTFTDLVASSPLNLNAGSDVHGDWWQGYSGNNIRQNVILRNNVCRDALGANSTVFPDDGYNGGSCWDHIIKGNIWDGAPLDPSGSIPPYGPTYLNLGGAAQTTHFVFENNTHVATMSRNEQNAGDQTYSSFKNNVMGGVNTTHYGDAQTIDAPFINNFFWGMAGVSPPTGGSNAGNYQYGSYLPYNSLAGDRNNYTISDFQRLFRDAPNGDYRPRASGTLLANMFAKVNAYDGTGAPYAANDVAGAWGSSALLRSYPF